MNQAQRNSENMFFRMEEINEAIFIFVSNFGR